MLRHAGLLICILAPSLFGPVLSARALDHAIRIDQPLHEGLRQPVRALFERLGLPNVDDALNATKAPCGVERAPEFLLFRIEAQGSCYGESCVTIIGRLESGSIVPEEMLFANAWFVQTRVANADGAPSSSLVFPNGDAHLTLARTKLGWIMFPGKHDTVWTPPPPRRADENCASVLKAPSPASVAAPPGFESFTRGVEELRHRESLR